MSGSHAAVETVRDGVIVFDGAIDNRAELARRLKRQPEERLSAQGDALVVLELYSALGEEGSRRSPANLPLPSGTVPGDDFSWGETGSGMPHSTSPPTAAAWCSPASTRRYWRSPGCRRRPNRDALQAIHSTKWVQPGVTCLDGIYPVAPGTWLSIERTRIQTARFWEIPIQVLPRDEAGHAAGLRSVFLETLRRQTEPYQRIGISLSGGLDSAVMAAGARHVAPDKELHTFSAGYGPDDRELVNAAKVARVLGTHHHPLVLDPGDLPDLLPSMVWHMEEPIGREDIAYLYVAAHEAARHVEPGPHRLRLRWPVRGACPGIESSMSHSKATPFGRAAPGVLRLQCSWHSAEERTGPGAQGAVFQGKGLPAPEVVGARPLTPLDGFGNGKDQPLSQFLRKGFLMLPYQSVVERLYAAVGVRVNAHHTDPEFLRAAFSIPDRLKIKGRTQKYILRKACSGLLPESILSYGKSFNRLKHDLHLSAVLDQLGDKLLAETTVSERGLFAPSYVSRLRQRPAGRPYSQERVYRLWSLLLTEMWSRIFLDHRGAEPSPD